MSSVKSCADNLSSLHKSIFAGYNKDTPNSTSPISPRNGKQICIVCKVPKSRNRFVAGRPICKNCEERMREEYGIDYAPAEGVTKLDAAVRLILGIRAQAVEDGRLRDWESYWLDNPDWKLVWSVFSERRFIQSS